MRLIYEEPNDKINQKVILHRHHVWRSHDPTSVRILTFVKKLSYPLFFHFLSFTSFAFLLKRHNWCNYLSFQSAWLSALLLAWLLAWLSARLLAWLSARFICLVIGPVISLVIGPVIGPVICPVHRKVTRSCKVQYLSKNNFNGSQFYLDRSIYVVFLLRFAKIQPMLPMEIQRILPQKLIRLAVILNIISHYE